MYCCFPPKSSCQTDAANTKHTQNTYRSTNLPWYNTGTLILRLQWRIYVVSGCADSVTSHLRQTVIASVRALLCSARDLWSAALYGAQPLERYSVLRATFGVLRCMAPDSRALLTLLVPPIGALSYVQPTILVLLLTVGALWLYHSPCCSNPATCTSNPTTRRSNLMPCRRNLTPCRSNPMPCRRNA